MSYLRLLALVLFFEITQPIPIVLAQDVPPEDPPVVENQPATEQPPEEQAQEPSEEVAPPQESPPVSVPSEEGVVRAMLSGDIGIAAWNAFRAGGGLTLETSPLRIGAGDAERLGQESVTVDFAAGRRNIVSLTLTLSEDFQGSLVLTDREGGTKTLPLHGTLTGALLLEEITGSFTLVVDRGTGLVSGITLADTEASDSEWASATTETANRFPEQMAALALDRESQLAAILKERTDAALLLESLGTSVTDLNEGIRLAEEAIGKMAEMYGVKADKLDAARRRITSLESDIATHRTTRDEMEADYASKLPDLTSALRRAESIVIEAASGAIAAGSVAGDAQSAFVAAKQSLAAAQENLSDAVLAATGASLAVDRAEDTLQRAESALRDAELLLADLRSKNLDESDQARIVVLAKRDVDEAIAALKIVAEAPAYASIARNRKLVAAKQAEVDSALTALTGAQTRLAAATAAEEKARADLAARQAAIDEPLADIANQNDLISQEESELAGLKESLPALEQSVAGLSEGKAGHEQSLALLREQIIAVGNERTELAKSLPLFDVLVLHAELQKNIADALLSIAGNLMETQRAELPPLMAAIEKTSQDIATLRDQLAAEDVTVPLTDRLSSLKQRTADIRGQDLTLQALAAAADTGPWLLAARSPIATNRSSLESLAQDIRTLLVTWTTDAALAAKDAAGRYADPETDTGTGSVYRLFADVRSVIHGVNNHLTAVAPALSTLQNEELLSTLQSLPDSIAEIAKARSSAETAASWISPIDRASWAAMAGLPEGARGMFVHPGSGNAYLAILDPTGSRILMTSQGPDNVLIMDAMTADASSKIRLQGHAGVVTKAAWSPDGSMVATASYDSTVKLWDAVTGTLRTSLPLRNLGTGVTFTPDGMKLIITVNESPTLVYDIAANAFGSELPKGDAPKVTPDGSQAVLLYEWDLVITHLITGEIKRVRIEDRGMPVAMHFTPGAHRAIVGTDRGRLVVINLDTASIIGERAGNGSRVTSIIDEPTGRVLVGDEAGSIAVYEKIDDASIPASTTFQLGAPAMTISPSPTGSGFTVLRTRNYTGNSRVVHYNLPDWEGGRILRQSKRAMPSAAEMKAEMEAFSSLWQKTKEVTAPVETVDWEEIRDDMKNILALYASGNASGAAAGVPIDTAEWPVSGGIYGGEKESFTHPGDGSAVFSILSPDGTTIALGSRSNNVYLADARTGKLLPIILKGHTNSVTSGAWSPDSTRLVTASYDRTARVFDVRLGKELIKIDLPVTGDRVAWGNDDQIVIAMSEQPNILYSVRDKKEIAQIPCQYCTGYIFTPDGRSIIFVDDRAPSIFNRSTKEIRRTSNVSSGIYASGLSPNGAISYFGTANGSTTVVDTANWSILANHRFNTTAIFTLATDPMGGLLQGHEDGSIYLSKPGPGGALAVTAEWHIGVPVASISVSPSGKGFIATAFRQGAPVLHFALPETSWAPAKPVPQTSEVSSVVRDAIKEIAAQYDDSDNYAQFARTMAEGPTEREEMEADPRAIELLAKSAALEVNAQVESGRFEELKDVFVDAAAFREEAQLPSMITSAGTVLDTLEAERMRVSALSTSTLRDAVRVGAAIERSQASDSQGILPVVSANDTVDIAGHSPVTEAPTMMQTTLELVRLGGVVTVHSLKGDTDAVSLIDAGGALRSIAKGTVLDFTTADSMVTSVRMTVEAQTGAYLRVHVLRDSEAVNVVELGTGRTLDVDEGAGISGILIEHPIPGMSQAARDWRSYRDSYQSNYLYDWQDPGPVFHYFSVMHPELHAGEVMAEAARGDAGLPVTIRSLDLRGNIAAPVAADGVMAPLTNGLYSRFWAPRIDSMAVPKNDPYEWVSYSPGKYNSVTLIKYRGDPVIQEIGTVNRGIFTPLPREMTEVVDRTVVISPLPSGLHLVARTTGGRSNIEKGSPPLGWTYDFAMHVKTGSSKDAALLPLQKSVTVDTDTCGPNNGGDGWFQPVDPAFSCAHVVAVGTLKARFILTNMSREAGTFSVTITSGNPGVEGAETVVFSDKFTLGPAEGKGLWKSVPMRTDSAGRGMVRIVVKDSDGNIVGEGGRTVGPSGALTAVEMEQRVKDALNNQAQAMIAAATETKAYFASINVTNPPSSYDWKIVLAENTGTIPEAPLSPQEAERFLRIAVNAKAFAKLTGDPVRIAAAESQLAGALTVYGGALAYAGSPEADKTPAALVALVEDNLKKEDVKAGIAKAQKNAISFVEAQTLKLARDNRMIEHTSIVAKNNAVTDAPISGEQIKSKEWAAVTKEYQFGILSNRDGKNPEQGIDIQGQSSDARVLFTVKEKSMVNLWVDSSELEVARMGAICSKYDLSLVLRTTSKNGFVSASSKKEDACGAESLSSVLEPGDYALTLGDETDYASAGSAPTINVPLHVQVMPYRSQKIEGRISTEGRDVSMPVGMSVAEFEDGQRKEDYSRVSSLEKGKPIWVVAHGMNDHEDAAGIESIAAQLSAYGSQAGQVVTIDWDEAAAAITLLANDAPWTKPVGEWTAGRLMDEKFQPEKINLVGHSHGTYVSFAAAKAIAQASHSQGVNALVALDPAGNVKALSGFDNKDINFGNVSLNSLSIEGSLIAGSNVLAATSDIAFQVDSASTHWPSTEHSLPVTAFSSMLKTERLTPGQYPKFFTLESIMTPFEEQPTDVQLEPDQYRSFYEGIIEVDTQKATDKYGSYYIGLPTKLIFDRRGEAPIENRPIASSNPIHD